MNDKLTTALRDAMEGLCMAASDLGDASDALHIESTLLPEHLWHTPVDHELLNTAVLMENAQQGVAAAQKIIAHILGEDELELGEVEPDKGMPYSVWIGSVEEQRELFKEADERRRAAARALRDGGRA